MTNLDKPLRIRFKPVASTTVGILGGGTVGITQKEPWLSLDDGLPIPHNGVSWWYQNTSAGANNTAHVYGLRRGEVTPEVRVRLSLTRSSFVRSRSD